MTFWGLEGKHIPFIIKSKNIQYQEALFILDSAPHNLPASPIMTPDKDGNQKFPSANWMFSHFLKIADS